jgi:hypothetical protein
MLFSYNKKEPKAKDFEYDLIAEIYGNYDMHPLWQKYQGYIKLPDHDDEHVIFEGSENDGEYKKLKDFIEDLERKLYLQEKGAHA